jgi:hypothetical protein
MSNSEKTTIHSIAKKTLSPYAGLSNDQLVAIIQNLQSEKDHWKAQALGKRNKNPQLSISRKRKLSPRVKTLGAFTINPFTKKRIMVMGRAYKDVKTKIEKTYAEQTK